MKTKQIYFQDVEKAVLHEADLDERLGPKEVLLQTAYTGVNCGTEAAVYQGLGSDFPALVGGSGVGKIVAIGSEVDSFGIGDKVFCTSPHESYIKATTVPRDFGPVGNCISLKIPDGFPETWAALLFHYSVSMSAIRQSQVSLGDEVLVIGGGIIGNTAAQLFKAAGASVMLTDLSEKRLRIAEACGIKTIQPQDKSLEEIVKEETNGRMLTHCVCAISTYSILQEVYKCVRRLGIIVMMGYYPKNEPEINWSAIFQAVMGSSLRIQGAGAHTYPVEETSYLRHTAFGHYREIIQLMQEGALKPEPLISLVSPRECQQVYQDIAKNKDKYLGVVFDWSSV